MAIEHACTRVVRKPWGSIDLRPWSTIDDGGGAIGELWFERTNASAPDPALLLKLLFTKEALSIQVHPKDAFARSIGLANGKTEAWYILSAAPGAQVAVGLKRQLTAQQLRSAIDDGSISELIEWRDVAKEEVIFVPAGTIHAIGPGLVIAEIQQRSDTTFRLFDHGRKRVLHVDDAVLAADAGPAKLQPVPEYIADGRTLLVANQYFVLEQFDLAPNTTWAINAEHETWVLALEGRAQVELIDVFVGEAIFLEAEAATLQVGSDGLKGLLAYIGPEPRLELLHKHDADIAGVAGQDPARPIIYPRAITVPAEVRL